jgi:8-oxo-dGTP pyrophosphatase MutT (NUDIX family)
MTSYQTPPQNITAAATVILAREQVNKLQIYLVKRSPKSGFMAGNYVFPGGSVEVDDQNIRLFRDHIDLNPDKMVSRFGGDLSPRDAMAYGVAAIRETLEEAGVFLADREDELEVHLEHARSLRLSIDLGSDWFSQLVRNAKWRLEFSALSCWSHWITPEQMKRRFDTRFFLAVMPPDQYCQPDAKETVTGLWLNPKEGLTGNLNGQIPLSPPTLVTLHELLKYPSLKELWTEAKNRQWGRPLLPRMLPLSKGAIIIEPWDPLYHEREIDISSDGLPDLVLPVGEPFSRLWYDDGIWKPIKVM